MSERSAATTRTVYGSVHYWIAVGVLLVAGGGMLGLKLSGFVMAKAQVPLNKTLDEFPDTVGERFVLWREYNVPGVAQQGKIQLTDDIVKVLGTEEFIDWFFIDREHSTEHAKAFVRFHVPYYTGLLDAAPHVPENCRVASGQEFDQERSSEVAWEVPDLPEAWAHWRQVKIRRAAFTEPGQSDDPTFSYYVFCANGEPMWSRHRVRLRMSNPFESHCYYMKIELTAGREDRRLTPAESDEMCRAFFAEALPLVLEHVKPPDELDPDKHDEAEEDAP